MNTSSTSYNGGGNYTWEINSVYGGSAGTLDGAQGVDPGWDFKTSPARSRSVRAAAVRSM